MSEHEYAPQGKHEGGEHGYEKTHHRLHEQAGPKGKPLGIRPSNSGGEGGITHSKEAHGHGHSSLRAKSDADGKVNTHQPEHGGGRESSNYAQPSGPAGASNLTKDHEGGVGFAEHHPKMGSGSHHFAGKAPSREAHSFRGTTRAGSERHSGNPNAHRIGRR